MDTYPCPACGGVADETDGCRSCGRAHDPVAATLARLNQVMAGLDDESRRLADDQSDLRARRNRLQAQRIALTNAVAQRLADEAPARKGKRLRSALSRTALSRNALSRTAMSQAAPSQRVGQTASPPGVTATTTQPVVEAPIGAETSPRSAQNTLLTLGGVLLGIAAIVFTGLFYSTTQTGGRAFILGIATTLCLGVPVLLARRTLTATAETIAGLGLLLVLLDGYVAYSADLAGLDSVSPPLFAAVMFALVAVVAAAYRLATHLRAPQFAALLAVQPLLPLIGVHAELGRNGFATIFAVVAAQNLGAVAMLSRNVGFSTPAGPLRGPRPGRPRMLRELAWGLFGVAMTMSAGLAVVGLVRADTVAEAVETSLVLLLAAAVGIAAGRLAGRDALRHIATGAAALAIIASVSRVNALALPQYTLVLTAATASGIAVAAGFLPANARRGPQVGSLIGAALAALVVAVSASSTAAAVVRAAITPSVWAADLAGYAERVGTTSWQVPASAVLLAVLAVAAAPPRWRLDAAVVGGFLVVLAAPGTGSIAWWVVPLLGAVASSASTMAALFAPEGRSGLIRSGSGGLLGLYAVATSLARPELTAAVCAILALVAAATAVSAAGWPDRFGPYADRVADSAGGAAAFTFPIAVGTYAWLGGAAPGVLLPLTMLATAVGVLAAALWQVAARMPGTGSAGGALAATVGCLVLSIQIDGTTPGDIGVAVLLLVAAAATAASRAFEVSAGGLVEGVSSVPTAAGALEDAIAGTIGGTTAGAADIPDRPRRRRQLRRADGITMGAALATAALIFAMARLFAVAVPGIGLVTTTAMVFAVSLGVLALPEAWRRGPRLGSVAVGGMIGALTAGIAITEAARVIAASTPFGAANLAAWHDRVSAWAPFGWQVPASLLLAAAAAAALLPAPVGGDVGFVTLSVAGLAAPAALGLAWWSPIAIAGSLAFAAGVGAALVGPHDATNIAAEDVARRRLGLAAMLGLYATAAAAGTYGSAVIALSGVVFAGVMVAAIAQARTGAPPVVPGVAGAAALIAAPGAAATIAVASGASRTGVLGAALALAAFGVLIVGALRLAKVRWGGYPAFGVGTAALVVALASLPDLRQAQVWAAAAALVAVSAAATLRSYDKRAAGAVIIATAGPAALLSVVASAPAWLTAVVGPYRTLRQIWQGYAVAPIPEGAGPAMVTLALLAAVAATTALTLGDRGHLLAAILPPLAALALVAPTAIGAPRASAPWVALGVALTTGLGAALAPPTVPSATRLLRGTAGIICAVTGGAGLAGTLATRGDTLTALGILVGAAAVAAWLGRDPAIRMVAWIVTAAAAFALPVTALAAASRPLRPGAFGVLGVCGLLVAVAWALARSATRRAEAAAVELCASLGAAFALLLALGSARHAAAVLTIWGLLLGGAALRRDRPAIRRQWLVRAALAAEVGASWVLLYSVEVGLTEAYTLPFAAVALLSGALELRRRPELSSWIAYGPALAGGFLPSLALVLVGDRVVWRWVALFAAAIVTVIMGTWRRRHAPVVTGSSVAVVVALTEMIRLLVQGAIAGAVLVAVAGVVLIVFGGLSEKRLRGALRRMS